MIRKSQLKLVKPDNPILHIKPDPFEFGGDIDAEMLSNLLIERMKELGGIGLSANQVGLNKAVFVMGTGDVFLSYFNPKITAVSAMEIAADEGCLTYPGVYVKVKRPVNIEVQYQTAKGETKTETLMGLTARVFQHEYDHMLGLTMKDKVSKLKWDLAYNRMVKRTKKIIKSNVQKQLIEIQKEVQRLNGK